MILLEIINKGKPCGFPELGPEETVASGNPSVSPEGTILGLVCLPGFQLADSASPGKIICSAEGNWSRNGSACLGIFSYLIYLEIKLDLGNLE